MLKVAVLVSGGGTNLQALFDAQTSGTLTHGRIACVISSRADAYALSRAQERGVPTRVLERRSFPDAASFDRALCGALKACEADLVVLAGFLAILGGEVLAAYRGRILNVHPSLIPSFCGPGYYGLRVHEAALQKGVKVTGATVHFVSEVVDGGAIVLQQAVPVEENDTPQSLQRRVMEQAEWKILPRAVELFCAGRLALEDGRTRILPEAASFAAETRKSD